MKKEIFYHVTRCSQNRKAQGLSVISSGRPTCPNACPFKTVYHSNGRIERKGCYGDCGGPIFMHWNRIDSGQTGISFDAMVERVEKDRSLSRMKRFFDVGDLPGYGNRINYRQLMRLANAASQGDSIAFTHKPLTPYNTRAIQDAIGAGFCVNLSTNNLIHADEVARLATGPVATVLPSDCTDPIVWTPSGREVRQCRHATEGLICADCGWCSKVKRGFIVGFAAHGSMKKTVDTIVRKVG